MPAIITSKFRINNAEQLVESFGETASTKMYLGIGRPYPWTNEKAPPAPVDTLEQEYLYWQDMLAVKRCTASDVTLSVIRRNWTSGQYYDMYRQDYSASAGAIGVNTSTGAAVIRNSLFDAAFFVVTDEYNVYKCLYNRNSSNQVVASTVKPTGKSTSAITTADGYVWKYMYTIAPSDVIKFISTDFMPVKEVTTNPGQYDAYIDQWSVREAAVGGKVDTVVVTNGGSGYTSAPTVAVLGDGTGATATAVIDSGSGQVVKINITNGGTGYTYATIQMQGGNGTNAAGRVILPPQRGHGFNPVEELGGYYVMMNVRLEYDDGTGDFPVDNDYRRIMLIRDPFNYGTTVISTATTMKATRELTINTAVSTFLEDEIITGGTSGAVGRIINIAVGASTTTIRYIQLSADAGNVNGDKFETAEVITGTTSLSTGTISALSNPEVEPFSGDVLYVENRRLINRAPDQIEDIKIIVEM